MITSRSLLTAIKTSEWHRYTGAQDPGYATAGTHGTPDAIELRCPLTLFVTDGPLIIQYRRVDDPYGPWTDTGYRARMRYDTSRDHQQDGDGYEFIPYEVTQLQLRNTSERQP